MVGKCPSGCGFLKIAGIAMAALGVILLLWVIPSKFWLAVLGLSLLAAGTALWILG